MFILALQLGFFYVHDVFFYAHALFIHNELESAIHIYMVRIVDIIAYFL